MSQNLVGAYERAVDQVVYLIDEFPSEEDFLDSRESGEADLLTGFVDLYAARAGELFDSLLADAAGEATYDRLFALAAGDFRLAAALVTVDEPWSGEAGAEERAAEAEDLRRSLGDLRTEMEEVKAAVRGGGEPEPEDRGFGGGGPILPGPQPLSGQPRTVPPLDEVVLGQRRRVDPPLQYEAPPPEQFEAHGRPLSGAAPGSVDVVHDEIDAVVKKASSEIADLMIGGMPVVIGSFGEFSEFLAGHLGSSYGHLQHLFGGWVNRAKRSALKLMYEGIDKLLGVLRHALPVAGAAGQNVRDALTELATWLGAFVLTEKVHGGLDYLLRIGDLKTEVATTFGGLSSVDREERTANAHQAGKNYLTKKFPMIYARVAIRVARILGLHQIPPYGPIAMGGAILALCGVSGWMAQDALDHPELRFVPNLSPGIRSAVAGI